MNRSLSIQWLATSLVILSLATNIHAEQEECIILFDKNVDTFEFGFDEIVLEDTNNLEIGEIILQRHNVFNENNEREQGAFYSFANGIHTVSHNHVIQGYLLFSTGDKYDTRILHESERLLRKQKYLFNARIIPFRKCGNTVDILVVTRDTWSLVPIISFSSQGGHSKTKYGVRDTNFLGSGKRISIVQETGYDDTSTLLVYDDPNTLGTTYQMRLEYEDSVEGSRREFELNKPFFSLDTEYAFGMRWQNRIQNIELYQLTESINQFKQDISERSFYLGYLYDNNETWYRRLLFGYDRIRKNHYVSEVNPDQTNFIPEDKIYSYPWFGISVVEDDFAKYKNLNFMDVDEDINLGSSFLARIGWSGEEQLATNDAIYFNLAADKAFAPWDDTLLTLSFAAEGFWNTHSSTKQDTYLKFDSKYFTFSGDQSRSYFHLSYIHYYDLPDDRQIKLDGETGMRGYPLNFLTGDEALLLQYEKRWYTDWHWFQLARVGMVAYIDVGKVWNQGNDNDLLLSDVGFGLRIMSSRAFVRNIAHIDIAFPIEQHEKADKWIFSFIVQEHF